MTWPFQNAAATAEKVGNKVLTFLSKLAQIILSVSGIAQTIGPIIKPFLGSGEKAQYVTTVTNDLTAVGQVVLQAETLLQGTKKGADRLAAAAPLVSNILKTSELIAGKKIADDALFSQAASKITSGVADLLNSISADEAKHAS